MESKKKFILKNLYPLKSYVNTNSFNKEEYSWNSGSINYYIKKDLITLASSRVILEIYASIYNNKSSSLLGETFMYKLPYNTGYNPFLEIEGWVCEII